MGRAIYTLWGLLGGHDSYALWPKSVPAGGNVMWLLVVSWDSWAWCLALRAEASSREELELLRASSTIASLTSWVELYIWIWCDRHWSGLPELLDNATGTDHDGMGYWCPEGPSPNDSSSMLPGNSGGLCRLPVLQYAE